MTGDGATDVGSARNLATKAVRGSLSVAFSSYAGFVLSFAGTAAVARFVGPSEFGSYALGQAYVQVLVACGGFAFTQAVLQSESESPALADTAMLLTLAVRVAIFVVALPIAWLVLKSQGRVTATVFLLLSAIQFLDAARVAMSMPLQRRVDYGKVAGPTLLGNLTAQAGGVAAAALGWGASSVVLRDALLAGVPLTVYLLKRREWNLASGSRFDRSAAHEAWRFGRSIWFVRLIDQGLGRLDRVVMGALFSLDAVGCYQQSRYIGSLPASAVAPGNLAVAVGMYSRVRSQPAHLSKAFDMVQYFVVRIVPPFAIICAVFPELIVTFLLGPKWEAAREPLRVAAAFALLQPILESYRALMESLQWWRLLRWASVLQFAVSTVLLLAMAGLGAVGAVGALSLGVLASTTFLGIASTRAVTAPAVPRYLPVVFATGLALIGAASAKQFLGAGVTSLIAGAAMGVGLYVAALLAVDGKEVQFRMRYIMEMLRGRGTKASAS